jgi:carboxyl-terminal processing protease
MKVTKVYDGSPADELGLSRGCYITAVDGVDVKTLSSVDAVQSRMRGESGTVVNITWLDTEAVEHTNDVTLSGYNSTTVDSEMASGNVGYIRIRQFDSTTPAELDYAIRTLTANGAESFVFDLRDNEGGVLDDALRCLDLICPESTLAYAEDRSGNRTVLGTSSDSAEVTQPIVCLVNGNTASAAELFASCLRALNGAKLVGTNTYGKGTIQSSPQRLSDGSAVVITVAKLLACDGSSFDGVGLTVDVERALTSDEEALYYDYTVDTDPQIQRALATAQYLTGSSTAGAVNESAASGESTAGNEETTGTEGDDETEAEDGEGAENADAAEAEGEADAENGADSASSAA